MYPRIRNSQNNIRVCSRMQTTSKSEYDVLGAKGAKPGSLVKGQSQRNRLFGSDKDSHYLVIQINRLSPTAIGL